MTAARSAALDALRALAREAAAHARAPYSGRAEGAALLLADGAWVPGARVENAAFPLSIPAAVAAVCSARVRGRAADVRAVALSHPLLPGEAESVAAALADALGSHALRPAGPDVLAADGDLPRPTRALVLTLDAARPADDPAGVGLAAEAAHGAYIPFSHFPVGCVVEAVDGRLFAGANVEHADWTRGLCAERVALATAVSAGARGLRRIWLACPQAPHGTPCGACRQVLAELAPGVPLVMWRGEEPPEVTTPEALLPGAFTGEQLRG